MRWKTVLFAVGVMVVCRVAHAEEPPSRWGIQSVGARVAYGIGDRSGLQFASLLPRVSFFLPRLIDEPLHRHGVEMEWVVEPIVSLITNSTTTVEAGINPIFVSFRYDRGQAWVPFFEGGLGVLYTGIQGEGLGTHFQFSSQAGPGVHWFFDRRMALTASYRFRHISNASISSENRGLNTNFFLFGVTLFPER